MYLGAGWKVAWTNPSKDQIDCYFSKLPDVVIDPRLSKIVEIMGGKMIESENCMAGKHRLLFPRIGPKGIRDKLLQDCMVQRELTAALERTHTLPDYKDIQTVESARKKRLSGGVDPSARKKAQKTIGYDQVDSRIYTTPSETGCNIMKGLCVCVLNGLGEEKQKALQTAKDLGAKIWAGMDPEVTHIIAIKNQGMLFENQEKKHVDIIKPQWLYDCLKTNKLLPLEPKYMWNTSRETEKLFANNFDRFGDSYTVKIDPKRALELLTEDDPQKWDVPWIPSENDPENWGFSSDDDDIDRAKALELLTEDDPKGLRTNSKTHLPSEADHSDDEKFMQMNVVQYPSRVAKEPSGICAICGRMKLTSL
jgi:BRCA1 C Terminus (BRCT) domain/DNA ligase IV